MRYIILWRIIWCIIRYLGNVVARPLVLSQIPKKRLLTFWCWHFVNTLANYIFKNNGLVTRTIVPLIKVLSFLSSKLITECANLCYITRRVLPPGKGGGDFYFLSFTYRSFQSPLPRVFLHPIQKARNILTLASVLKYGLGWDHLSFLSSGYTLGNLIFSQTMLHISLLSWSS